MNSDFPTNEAAPRALSEQERQQLDAAAKGYDDDASALPDPDRPRKADTEETYEAAHKPEPASEKHRDPTGDAQRKGMLPEAGKSSLPIDQSDAQSHRSTHLGRDDES